MMAEPSEASEEGEPCDYATPTQDYLTIRALLSAAENEICTVSGSSRRKISVRHMCLSRAALACYMHGSEKRVEIGIAEVEELLSVESAGAD